MDSAGWETGGRSINFCHCRYSFETAGETVSSTQAIHTINLFNCSLTVFLLLAIHSTIARVVDFSFTRLLSTTPIKKSDLIQLLFLLLQAPDLRMV